jgi:isoleucyl-tRNA synthetase
MHELWTLENVAKEGYASYNFPKGPACVVPDPVLRAAETSFHCFPVVHALTNFASLILSSLYFDITKDCLYANTNRSQARRAVLTVLEQVKDSPEIWKLAHEGAYRF